MLCQLRISCQHRSGLAVTWHSQAGQDEWVHGIVGDTGYFVDVGAHDGIVHSNTYALEQRGWIGICIEPNLDAFVVLASCRRADCSPMVVTDHNGIIEFDGVHVGSGFKTPCRSLTDILVECEAPPFIDYISIDVEGHELEVLAGMDFDRWTVRCLTVEHNLYCDGPARKDAIHEHLNAHGFARVVEDVVAPGYGGYEDWYLSCGG